MMAPRKNAIVVVGSANMDMVAKVKKFPRPGETIFGTNFGMFPGGKGANQAVCAAKLGASVSFLGKIGSDVLGEKLAVTMKRHKVNLRHLIKTADTTSGTALITVDGGGENEIIVVSGSNMTLRSVEIRKRKTAFLGAAVVLLQLEIPLEVVREALMQGKRHGAMTILNPAPAAKTPRSMLRLVDYLTPNETEAEILTGIRVSTPARVEKAALKLLELGVRNVIVTLGRHGSLLVNRQVIRKFPSVKVRAVDSTGAGDAFSGALAVALAAGKRVEEAIIFASRVAAFSVTRMGAIPSMPTMRDLRAWNHSPKA